MVFGPQERIIGYLCVIRSSTDTASMGQDREEVFKAVNLSLLLPFTASVSRVRNESAYISVSLKKKTFYLFMSHICLVCMHVRASCAYLVPAEARRGYQVSGTGMMDRL